MGRWDLLTWFAAGERIMSRDELAAAIDRSRRATRDWKRAYRRGGHSSEATSATITPTMAPHQKPNQNMDRR